MKRKFISVILLLILFFQNLMVFLPIFKVNAVETISNEVSQVAAVDFFDIAVSGKVSGNYGTTFNSNFDRGVLTVPITLLDHNDNLNIVYYDDNYICIQKFNSKDEKKTLLQLEKKYPIFGNITIDSSGNYYIAWAINDNSNKVAFAISKYNYWGTHIATYEKTYDLSYTVFNLSTCRLDITDTGIIGYNYAIEGMGGHQYTDAGYVDSSTMQEATYYKTYPYTSHAMFTDVIAVNEDDFIFVNQGDGYSRGYDVTYINNDMNNDSYFLGYKLTPFQFREGPAVEFGYNATFSAYGGVEKLDTGIALIASSEKTLSLNPAPSRENESRNLFIQIIKEEAFGKKITANSFVTSGERVATGTQHTSEGNIEYFLKTGAKDYGVQWLTNYNNDYTISNVKTVEIDNDRIAIFWTRKPYTENVDMRKQDVYYMVISNTGEIIQDETLVECGWLPNYSNLVYKDGYVYYTNTDNTTNIRIYKLKLYETKEATKITSKTDTITVNNLDSFNIQDKFTVSVNNGHELEFSTNSIYLDIDENGIATPKKTGTAKITVTVKDIPKITKTLTLVIDVKTTAIILDQTNIVFNVNSTNSSYIRATVTPTGASTILEWYSTDESIAKIEYIPSSTAYAKIVPVGEGYCEIVAKTTDGSNVEARCKVGVVVPIKDIEITESDVLIGVGEKYKLTYTAAPDNATNKNVIWESTNPLIVTVDKNGIIEGVAEGTAKIKAISEENSNIYSVCDVEVSGQISDKWVYEELKDGNLCITKYTGSDEYVKIPSQINGKAVTEIKSYIFGQYDNKNNVIKKVTVPNGITSIDSGAFSHCNVLTEINISETVTSIQGTSILNCPVLEKIIVSENNPVYMSQDNILYEKKNNLPYYLIIYPEGKKDTSYITPESLYRIDNWGICNNPYLKEITVLSNVNSIGYNSLYCLENLSKLYIINKNTTFGMVVSDCPNLTIYGVDGSKAQIYANDESIPFVIFTQLVESLSVKNANIYLNDTTIYHSIETIVLPLTATTRDLTYEVEDENIITISNVTGRIKGKSNGTTKVYVRTTDGSNLTAVVNVTVDIKCTSLYYVDGDITISKNKELSSIFIFPLPTNAKNQELSFKIEDSTIAKIENETIIPLKNGTTNLIVSTTDGSNISKTIPLIVTGIAEPVKCTSIYAPSDTITLEVNTDLSNLGIYAMPTNASVKTLSYEISDTTIAKIENGRIVLINDGVTTLIVKTTDGSNITKTINLKVDKAIPFTDVRKGSWCYEAVKFVYKNGYILGTTPTTYEPGSKLSRGMIVTILWRMEGKQKVEGELSFPDVKENQYFYEAIKWAAKNGIVNGYENGTFAPNKNVTREELAVILRNYTKKYRGIDTDSIKGDLTQFNDSTKVSSYAVSAMEWAVGAGVITGFADDNTMRCYSTATRDVTAAMIKKYCDRVK